jgi:hypothetical protein
MAFLSYDPTINDFVWVESEEDIFWGPEAAQVSSVPGAATTIKQVLEGTGGVSPASELLQTEGSIFRGVAGLKGFNTVREVLMAPSSLIGKIVSGAEGVTEYRKDVSRAEVFERAASPTATVNDMLRASQLEPTLLDYGKAGLMVGLDLFTGNLGGLALGSGPGLAATFAADVQASQALEKAGTLEQESISTGTPAFGTIGGVNTVANFLANQQANLAAARVDSEPTTFAPLTASQTTSSIISGATGDVRSVDSRGDTISRTEFSGGGSFEQNISENRRTQERRESEGYTGSTAADRRGTPSHSSEGATGSASDRETPSTSGYTGAYGF